MKKKERFMVWMMVWLLGCFRGGGAFTRVSDIRVSQDSFLHRFSSRSKRKVIWYSWSSAPPPALRTVFGVKRGRIYLFYMLEAGVILGGLASPVCPRSSSLERATTPQASRFDCLMNGLIGGFIVSSGCSVGR